MQIKSLFVPTKLKKFQKKEATQENEERRRLGEKKEKGVMLMEDGEVKEKSQNFKNSGDLFRPSFSLSLSLS